MCRPTYRHVIFAVCIGLAAAANPVFSQTTGEVKMQAPTATTRLVTLGTAAGPLPRKDRPQSANLLIVNGVLYLVDAGENVTRRIVQADYDFRKVGKIFITHGHSDHTMGLATLLELSGRFNAGIRLTSIDPSVPRQRSACSSA